MVRRVRILSVYERQLDKRGNVSPESVSSRHTAQHLAETPGLPILLTSCASANWRNGFQ